MGKSILKSAAYCTRFVVALIIALFQAPRRKHHVLAFPISKKKFIRKISGRPALEIGPFDNPYLKGEGVSYFDVLDQVGLRKRAELYGRHVDGCPSIEFVSNVGDLSVVDKEFSVAFSSHVIEHQPDLIRHFNEVERFLKTDGRYYLIIPDKRFTFDFYIPTSSYHEVKSAHSKGQILHSEDAIRAHYMCTTHNNAIQHWLGIHGKINNSGYPRELDDALDMHRSGKYVDVHAWTFTPESFRTMIIDLTNSGAIGLELEQVFDTRFGALEFFAVLRVINR